VVTAVTSSQLLWYTTRATGIVALVLLTGTVVLGVLTSMRFATVSWPRFAVGDLHRRISLLAVVFLALHVVTTVSDSYAPIGWLSVVVPFTSSYRRLWLGLGTVAVDLLAAVTISSLLRQRINPRTWRALHWLSYASWPLAVVHGLGTGTDPRLRWVIALVVVCVGSVLASIGWRLAVTRRAQVGARVAAGAVSVVAVLTLAAWTATGPLRPGWAARAGTPRSLLGHAQPAAAVVRAGSSPATSSPTTSSPAAASPAAGALPAPPYRASFTGTLAQQSQAGGSVRIEIRARTAGTLSAVLDIVMNGAPDGSGGVVLDQSRATFGSPGAPTQYRGQIVQLDGARIVLGLRDGAASSLDLVVDVTINGSQVSGTFVSATGTGDDGGLGAGQ